MACGTPHAYRNNLAWAYTKQIVYIVKSGARTVPTSYPGSTVTTVKAGRHLPKRSTKVYSGDPGGDSGGRSELSGDQLIRTGSEGFQTGVVSLFSPWLEHDPDFFRLALSSAYAGIFFVTTIWTTNSSSQLSGHRSIDTLTAIGNHDRVPLLWRGGASITGQ